MMKKFNLIDVLIVLVVLLGLAFLANRMTGTGGFGFRKDTTVLARYKIELTGRTAEYRDNAFKVGDTVYLGEKERTRGVVTGIETKDCYRMTLNSVEGRYDWNLVPDRYDVILSIASSAVETEDDIKAEGQTPLHVGEGYVVRGKESAGIGFMIDLWIAGKDKDGEFVPEVIPPSVASAVEGEGE